MRLIGRQARFLAMVLAGYGGARTYLLLSESDVSSHPAEHLWAAPRRNPSVNPSPIIPSARAEPVEALSFFGSPALKKRAVLRQAQDERNGDAIALVIPAIVERQADVPAIPALQRVPPIAVAIAATEKRLDAQAYLYLRGGGQAALGQGELGGSQIAARVAWGMTPRVGIAARFYAPIRTNGAEASLGIDLHPFPKAPFRLSIERRQRLDAAGRNAWSAYMAGGFYRGGRPNGIEIDGYAQAGIVGTQRRDGFVDGALRIGYRLPPTRAAIVLGAGVWAAAQPGVSRVDIGPRAVVRLALEGHTFSAALDGRIRLAGNARPGSGAALTLASDF